MRLTLIFVALCLVGSAFSMRRVCYYTNWAQYRNGPAKFFPENVDPSLCTHVIYAFAKLVGNKLTAFEWNDESTPWMKGMYERFAAIKTTNPSIKTLLSVGGWNMGSAPFTRMVASDSSRREFATYAVTFLRKHNFDGIDIDWEYPANRGSPLGDRHKFTVLLQTVHEVFSQENVPAGKQPLMIASAVAAGKSKLDTAYEIAEISKYLDMINLMSYDLHGSWEDHTGHVAPLYGRSGEVGNETTLNVDWAAQYWVANGAPRDKLNIGMALYGRTFKLPWSHTSDGMGAPAAGAGQAGLYTRENGFMAYYEVCKKLQGGATRHYEAQQKVPYFVDGDLWCGYEDQDSLKLKVDYVKQEGFGGVMVWSLDLDDFSGSCGQGKYPLMRAIVQELGAPSGGVLPVHTNPPVVTTTTTRATPAPWTPPPQTQPPHTQPPQTQPPQTQPPQTQPPITTTQRPTTQQPTTQAPTTQAPTTQAPTTQAPTTQAPATTTQAPVTTTRAPVTTTQPPMTTTQPPMTTTQPPVTTAQQVSTAAPGGPHHEIRPVSMTEFDCARRNDGYYPSPTSCTEYYICAAAVAFKTDCHPGLYFNDVSLYCDFSDHVHCQRGTNNKVTQPPRTVAPVTAAPVTQAPNTPAPTAPPQTPAPIVTTAAGKFNPSTFCIGKQDGFYPDPTDCSYFFQCSFQKSFHDPCPSGTYFSTSLQGCDWAANVPNCP